VHLVLTTNVSVLIKSALTNLEMANVIYNLGNLAYAYCDLGEIYPPSFIICEAIVFVVYIVKDHSWVSNAVLSSILSISLFQKEY